MSIYMQLILAQDAALGAATNQMGGQIYDLSGGVLTLSGGLLQPAGGGPLTLQGPPSGGSQAGGGVAQAPGAYSLPWWPSSPSSGGSGGLKQASGGYSFPWKPPPTPNSLFKVRIINTGSLLGIVGPTGPSAGWQPKPKRPHAVEPLPLWLRPLLQRLRVYLRPRGTIELRGFRFNPKELSAFAGVTVRDVS